ncbi:hypothetical protein Tco_0816641 [Tanacetum coccineum]
MVPRTVLTRSGLISLNIVRPVNTVQPRTAVNTIKETRVNTARPKAVISVVKGNKVNAVKASACWGLETNEQRFRPLQQYCVLSYLGLRFGHCVLVTAFWLLKVAFCLLEDLTAFCLKISLRFASRPHCVLLQDIHCVLLEDLTAFCLKTSLRFASRPHCVLLQVITAFCFNITAFCSRPPLRFA